MHRRRVISVPAPSPELSSPVTRTMSVQQAREARSTVMSRTGSAESQASQQVPSRAPSAGGAPKGGPLVVRTHSGNAMRLTNPNYNASVRNSKVVPSPEMLQQLQQQHALARASSADADDAAPRRTNSASSSAGGRQPSAAGSSAGKDSSSETADDGSSHWTTCANNAYGAWIHVALQVRTGAYTLNP
jgi:hypothetical protein